jgi:hypothetical protein
VSIESNRLWADDVFGRNATDLREVIRKSLTAACVQSQNAQAQSKARKKYPFGSSLWTLQFQELEDRMVKKFRDRVRLVALDTYSLPVFDGYVLYPVRSANTKSSKAMEARVRRPVSKLRRQMYSTLGPEPIQGGLWTEQAAQETARDLRTLMARLGPDIRLGSISYVCDYKPGLVNIYWGDAELDFRTGQLLFHDGEELPLVVEVAKSTRKRRSDLGARAFDGGEMPKIELGVNVSRQPASPEAEPAKPVAVSHEEE